MEKLKISARDKALLCVLFAFVVVFCSYYFVYNKNAQKIKDIENEIVRLNGIYDELKDKYDNKEEYIAKTKAYETYYKESLQAYDTGFSQRETILFSNSIEKDLGIWFKYIGLEEANKIFTFGEITSTNPNNSGTAVYKTDMEGYSKTTSYQYECSYEKFKELLDFIINYDTRYVINSVATSYNSEDDIVSGNIVITKYAVTGKDREYVIDRVEDIDVGTDNLFIETGYTGKTDSDDKNIFKNYDIALTLNSATSDIDAVTMERRGVKASIISKNENEEVMVAIKLSGEDGIYTVSYMVGDDTYPSENYMDGTSINPGQSLDMVVFSTRRKGDNDKAGAIVYIDNLTDMKLNIYVVDDDESEPRFILADTTGKVNVINR